MRIASMADGEESEQGDGASRSKGRTLQRIADDCGTRKAKELRSGINVLSRVGLHLGLITSLVAIMLDFRRENIIDLITLTSIRIGAIIKLLNSSFVLKILSICFTKMLCIGKRLGLYEAWLAKVTKGCHGKHKGSRAIWKARRRHRGFSVALSVDGWFRRPILKRGTLLKDQRDFEDRWLSTFDFATYVFRKVYQLVASLRGRNPPLSIGAFTRHERISRASR